jgi:hypothetical protein
VRISFLYNEVVEYKGGALTLKLRLQGSLGPWGSTCGEPAPACPAQPLSELPRPRCCWGVSPHLRQSWLQKGRCHHPHFRIDSEKGSLSAVTSRVACPGRESPDPDSSDPSRLPSRAPPPPRSSRRGVRPETPDQSGRKVWGGTTLPGAPESQDSDSKGQEPGRARSRCTEITAPPPLGTFAGGNEAPGVSSPWRPRGGARSPGARSREDPAFAIAREHPCSHRAPRAGARNQLCPEGQA